MNVGFAVITALHLRPQGKHNPALTARRARCWRGGTNVHSGGTQRRKSDLLTACDPSTIMHVPKESRAAP